MKQRILFIFNPLAGVQRNIDLEGVAREQLDPENFDVEIKATEGPGHASQLATAAVADGVDLVAAVGGDGSMNEVASALVNTNIPLIIIPTGSGNGLARHLGIPLDFRRAVGLIADGRDIKMDVGRVGEKYFFNMAGIGFDGLISKEFARFKRRGYGTYVCCIIQNLLSYKAVSYKLSLDGKQTDVKSKLIAIANAQQYGNNFVIAPQAKHDDGLLDVHVVSSFRKILSLWHLIKLFMGGYYINHKIKPQRVKQLTISSQVPLDMHLDGEVVEVGKEVSVTVEPLALTVRVP